MHGQACKNDDELLIYSDPQQSWFAVGHSGWSKDLGLSHHLEETSRNCGSKNVTWVRALVDDFPERWLSGRKHFIANEATG